MTTISAEHINPFLLAARDILKAACQIEATIGRPSLAAVNSDSTADSADVNDKFAINISVTGEISGQAMIAFHHDIACDIASRMCMMPITQMDELSKSAICELGNMIMGNAATIFSTQGTLIDITPPMLIQGDILFSTSYTAYICVPIIYDTDKRIDIHFAVRGNG